MTAIGALSSVRERGEMSPHKRRWDLKSLALASIHNIPDAPFVNVWLVYPHEARFSSA
jgi:hypothetical protein